MHEERADEVWILGATGRVGRAVAGRLASAGMAIVLVGRNRDRLEGARATLGESAGIRVCDSSEQIVAEIRRARPAVVVNLIGAYAETAEVFARACMPGGHYLDAANDIRAARKILALHEDAVEAGNALVTGAGFGVMATESVVAKLCEGRPVPDHVRIDALASVAMEAGTMGVALAESFVDVIATGGGQYQNGRLIRARIGADARHLELPDGQTASAAGIATAELLAAKTSSDAPSVIAASALAPASPLARTALALFGVLLSVPVLRGVAVNRVARIRMKAAPRPRLHSWGHATARWDDGTVREGWLRADDAMDFTVGVVSEIAARLAQGNGTSGAYFPAAAFGPELAVAAGGTFILEAAWAGEG